MGRALDSVNETFLSAYEAARVATEDDAPIFVVLADVLVVVHGGARVEHTFTPPLFHVIKSVAHAPLAIFAALHRNVDRTLDVATLAALETFRAHVSESVRSLGAADERGIEPETFAELEALLGITHAFVEHVLAAGVTARELDAFARDTGPRLLRLTTHATRIQLTALDRCTNEALAALSRSERSALQIVVAGVHQARVRSLGMQYFCKRMGEGSPADLHVTYGEGITTIDEAIALVGRRRVDVAIALAFFGDAKRLQRDVLGDAVHALLETRELARIA